MILETKLTTNMQDDLLHDSISCILEYNAEFFEEIMYQYIFIDI